MDCNTLSGTDRTLPAAATGAGTQITAEVYAHLTTPAARKAMDTLGDSLGL